jgi:branched-chain amino acid transport system permease protein
MVVSRAVPVVVERLAVAARDVGVKAAPALAVYAVLAVLYFTVPAYSQFVSMMLFYVILGQAFNLFMGMTGYVDFGYVAFLALGAYGVAVTAKYLGVTGWSLIPVGLGLAVAFALALALAVGAIALRLRGAYFAIATIGVNEGIRYLIEGSGIWGGSLGVVFARELREALGREAAVFLMTTLADVLMVGVGVLAVIVTAVMLVSRVGYALQAIREDEDAAKALGINVTAYKIVAFSVSAVIGSLLGATYWALKSGYVEPDHVFNIHYTVEAIVIVMLGGAGTILGPVVGGVVYGSLSYTLATIMPGLQLLALAPILLAVITLAPDGLVGSLRRRIRNPLLRSLVS